jgi:Flp pilus assembly protein TadD/mono/diheme cytochrome c family protein
MIRGVAAALIVIVALSGGFADGGPLRGFARATADRPSPLPTAIDRAALKGPPLRHSATRSKTAALQASVDYARDIGPLLADRCGACHRPNGPAPFSLLTEDEARRHATQIAAVTRSRYMPPWKVEPDDGPFIGQHPLSEKEIELIREWVDGDARPKPSRSGDHDGRLKPSRSDPGERPGEWQLGKPDLVVTLTQPYTLQAEGTDVFRIFVLPIPVGGERFVRGVEFHPGNPKVVHHANIRVDRTPESRGLDDADPGPGYNGLILRSAEYPDGHFLGWTPGQVAPLVPPDLAWRLEKDTDLVVEVHMQPDGREESVQPSIAFYFGDTAPTRTPVMLRLGRQTIDIPAGEPRYVVRDSYVLPVDVEVQALQPHAHYRAREVRGDATLPDGTTKRLLLIRDWDFRWQHVYRYVTPLALPKGTTVSMQYVYDNSTANPRNPEHPPARARWGQRSADEMGDLWIQVLTRSPKDLLTLDTAFRRKVVAEDVNGYELEIERHPADVGLRDTAAMLYLELGRPDDAAKHFRASVQARPDSAPAHYNLGTALSLARRLDEAMREYQQALALDPSYANAHNNLGNVLLAIGRNDDAIREFSEVVRLQPRSAAALANLAAAYAAAQQFERAAELADAALRLKPAEPLASTVKQQRDRYRRRAPGRD